VATKPIVIRCICGRVTSICYTYFTEYVKHDFYCYSCAINIGRIADLIKDIIDRKPEHLSSRFEIDEIFSNDYLDARAARTTIDVIYWVDGQRKKFAKTEAN